MTHDLITRILHTLEFEITKVIIKELREMTFYAVLELQRRDSEHHDAEKYVDCRPSDAIALAVQTGARIFVARKVLDEVAPG